MEIVFYGFHKKSRSINFLTHEAARVCFPILQTFCIRPFLHVSTPVGIHGVSTKIMCFYVTGTSRFIAAICANSLRVLVFGGSIERKLVGLGYNRCMCYLLYLGARHRKRWKIGRNTVIN